jgi:hypothetical protein
MIEEICEVCDVPIPPDPRAWTTELEVRRIVAAHPDVMFPEPHTLPHVLARLQEVEVGE